MTDPSTRMDSMPSARATSPVREIEMAHAQLIEAQCSEAANSIEQAQRKLQFTVDVARQLNVGWGQIGSVLGIARGNAYQRYRHRPSVGDECRDVGKQPIYRNPSL